MKIEFSPDIQADLKAGTISQDELYAYFCREHHHDWGDVDEWQSKENEETIRARTVETLSMYRANNGKNIYFVTRFNKAGEQDAGIFMYVTEY